MSILTIPLEISSGQELINGKLFNLGIRFERDERYEICVSTISCVFDKHNEKDHIYTLYCDALDQTSFNPSGIILRFSKSTVYIKREWYILDSYDLVNISLKLLGEGITSTAITLQLRKHGQKDQVQT